MVAARLKHFATERHLVPPEQVDFREKRGVEDAIARMIQHFQDGWQKKPCPPSRKTQMPDGEAVQKYVLVAYDFARAYDKVDHWLLRARLAELGVPACLNTWVWSYMRDRRACVELNGTRSGERVYRAAVSSLRPCFCYGRPRSSPPSGTCQELRRFYSRTTPLPATLCLGNTIDVARERVQLAADTLVCWARRNKMEVAGQKTQLPVLSQNFRDDSDCQIKVAGQAVRGTPELKLLGVTVDRTLTFGPHCRNLCRRIRPRTAQLRRLTGRSWGPTEEPALSSSPPTTTDMS